MRVNFHNFHVVSHSVEKREIKSDKADLIDNFHETNPSLQSTVWKLRNFTFTHFWQKFRESNVFITQRKVLNS